MRLVRLSHHPQGATRRRISASSSTLVMDECQARALFHRKSAAFKPGSRLMRKQHFIDSGCVAGMTVPFCHRSLVGVSIDQPRRLISCPNGIGLEGEKRLEKAFCNM